MLQFLLKAFFSLLRLLTAEFDLVFLDAFQPPLIQEAPPLQLFETSTASTTTEPVKIENNNFEQGNDFKPKC